jgi:4,5-dihydroxyphthalate decarboxylase
MPPIDLMASFRDYDVVEFPLAPFLIMRELGDMDYMGLPVFPHRTGQLRYLHGPLVRAGSEPQVLNGAVIASPGLFLSGTVWARGLLAERCGFDERSATWVTSGVGQPSQSKEMLHRVCLERTPNATSVEAPIAEALATDPESYWVGPTVPTAARGDAPTMARLLPVERIRSIEREWFEGDGYLPILHTVLVRSALVHADPGLPAALVHAFGDARRMGRAWLENHGVLGVGLPWLWDSLEQSASIFADDPFSVGWTGPNLAAVDTLARYARQQNLLSKTFEWQQSFAWDI